MNQVTTLIATFGLTLGTAGIAHAQTEAPPASQPETQSPPMGEMKAETKIELLDAGSAPQQQLRLSLTEGAKHRMETETTQTMTTSMNGNQMPPQEVTSTMVMTTEVMEATEDGEWVIKYITEDTSGQMAAAGETEVMITMNNRGIASDVQVQNEDPMVAEMIGNSISEMTVPLPEEAVGVGAKWKVTQNISMMGMTIDQTSYYEIVGMSGDSVEMKVTMEQSADAQEFTPPGAPEGMVVTVDSLKSEGNGTMTLQLSSVAPVEAAMNLAMEMAMQAQGMNINQDMNIESKSKSSAVE